MPGKVKLRYKSPPKPGPHLPAKDEKTQTASQQLLPRPSPRPVPLTPPTRLPRPLTHTPGRNQKQESVKERVRGPLREEETGRLTVEGRVRSPFGGIRFWGECEAGIRSYACVLLLVMMLCDIREVRRAVSNVTDVYYWCLR